MRMLLTSSGTTNKPIVSALRDLLGRPFAEAKVAVVLTASLVTPGDKSWVLDSIFRLRELGWAELDLIDLNSGPVSVVEGRLRDADVVYVHGGNHYFLAHSIQTRGLQPLFRKLVESKVYVGESAGSMIFTPHLSTGAAAIGDQTDMEFLGIESVEPAVDLFDWYFKPHLHSPVFEERTDDWAKEHARLLGVPSWFVDDDTALLVTDPSPEPTVVSEGSWLQFGAGGTPV